MQRPEVIVLVSSRTFSILGQQGFFYKIFEETMGDLRSKLI
jgi:hypothetical protein